MREKMELTLCVLVILASSVVVEPSQEVVKAMTKKFLKAYEVCAKEYNLPESTATQMMNFWREDFAITSRDAGCALLCLSTKFDLIDPEGKLHHGNAVEFAKQHGSDEATAKQLVDFLHACEQSVTPNEDKCVMALDVAMCFKKELHKLNWAPDSDLLFEEMIAEMN